MARLTEKTVYGALLLKTGVTVTGTFALIRIYRFGSSFIAFQHTTVNAVYPWDSIRRASIAT